MNILVLLIAVSCVMAADLQAIETQPAARSVQTTKTSNSIPISQKPDQYYQQLYQPSQLQYAQLQQAQVQQPYSAVQYAHAGLYQQQQQQQPQAHAQPAIIIIAQPTPVPPQAAISQAAQQLLNYFHANPQARYQFLQGNYQPQPQPQPQPTYVPQQTTAPTYTYQVMTVQPQYQQVQSAPHPSSAPFIPSPQISQQVVPVHVPQQVQPVQQHSIQSTSGQQSYTPPQVQLPIIGQFGHSTHIPHIATLAQLTTQKYLPQLSLRATAPAIITGLENFTPEQQAQLKEQLQSGGPLTPLRSSLPPNFGANVQDSPAIGKSAGPATQSTSPQEFPQQDNDKPSAQQTQSSTSSTYNPGYSSQFSKG